MKTPFQCLFADEIHSQIGEYHLANELKKLNSFIKTQQNQ